MPRPLRVGDPVPPFRALDGDGVERTEKDFAGAPWVVYFYPADETPGCVAQGCAFRDRWEEFRALGVPVVGVSRDPPESHREFARRRRLPFALLSDGDGAMHRAFGALALGVLPRRVTYLLDARGRVAAAFSSHLRPEAHAGEMLEAARRLMREERA